jgi:fermentation-respiration switch protein FrsA (DUF1100 family)
MDKPIQLSYFKHIEKILPYPILPIADTKYLSEKAIVKTKEPKKLYIIEGATHIDLYD